MTKKEQPATENIESKEEIDYKAIAQRTQANFENYRKQTEKRIADFQDFATKSLMMGILPVVDNFNLALKNTENAELFQEGVELIYSELNDLLEKNKVEPFETIGKLFDPYYHEALMKEVSEEKENTIIDEFQKGYTMNGKVIRSARVKISAGKKKKN